MTSIVLERQGENETHARTKKRVVKRLTTKTAKYCVTLESFPQPGTVLVSLN